MGYSDEIQSSFDHPERVRSLFRQVLYDTRAEHAQVSVHLSAMKINKMRVYLETVKKWPDKQRVAFILDMVKDIDAMAFDRDHFTSLDSPYDFDKIRKDYIRQLFRSKLVMDDQDVRLLVEAFAKNRMTKWAVFSSWPIGAMLTQIARQHKGKELSPELQQSLNRVKQEVNKMEAYLDNEKVKLTEKIDEMLFAARHGAGTVKPVRFIGNDPFAEYANAYLETIGDTEIPHWYALLDKASKCKGSKPSARYLKDSQAICKEIGYDRYKEVLMDWLNFVIQMQPTATRHAWGEDQHYLTYEFLAAPNSDSLKGLVWVCSHFHDSLTLQTLASLAERAYKKIPGKGPAAAGLGNACIYVLFSSRGLEGIGHLSRLKLRIKQANTQGKIQQYLNEAASQRGVSIEEIEDLSVSDFGLKDGIKTIAFEDYKARLRLTGVGKSQLEWIKPNGDGQKSVPAFVKEKHGPALKKLRRQKKQIEQTLSAQRDRIDRMFRLDRQMDLEHFLTYYLNHGLMSFLCRRLIWVFREGEQGREAIYYHGQWIDNQGAELTLSPETQVSLWHPATSTPTNTTDWRDFLVFREIQQPMKQAFREVYLITDAEIHTGTYSNRMAAHILKQHQFNVLAKTRGWKYSLIGAFDGRDFTETATLDLPHFNLQAAYWVQEVNQEHGTNDSGIWSYISTDQVRFNRLDNEEVVELSDIPPLVFSEVMRDVDLFVGVASVGNDPEWQDSGDLPAHRDYWHAYSFGDLSEIAKTRKEILRNLIPRLKIAKVAEIRGNFLVVKGEIRTYKIHIGSTNILMEPNDQYLCIVPDNSKKDHTNKVFLPFEGDKGLSIILSKAFLLAEDNKIKDSTIVSQIEMR